MFLIHCFADCPTCARSTPLEGEFTSMKITQDSQYALITHSPNVRELYYLFIFGTSVYYRLAFQEIYLWDIHTGEIARKYSGQKQSRHVIRSCFGGTDDNNFIVSGSEGENKNIILSLVMLSLPLTSKFFGKMETYTYGIAALVFS